MGSEMCIRDRLIVRGGSFKCAHLEPGSGDFALLGEGVAPGFDFRDFAFVTATELRSLLPHATEARYVQKWEWRRGDLVVWDNRCTMHCATGFDWQRHTREMWRTTIVRDAATPTDFHTRGVERAH